jgi:5'-nucleotidase
MTSQPNFLLLTNDDGVNALGLCSLEEALRDDFDVQVVAPSQNWSGSSHALTLKQPLYTKTHTNGFISTTGTPVDSVHIGLTRLVKKKPSMVISGINHGANMGDDVLYSGTIAAAMEGRFINDISLAFSLASFQPVNFDAAGQIANIIVKKALALSESEPMVLNVNIPDIPYADIRGIRVTRLGRRSCPDSVQTLTDPKGNTVYWIGPPGDVEDDSPGTDFHAVSNGFVSITPISVDKTANKAIVEMKERFDCHF